jgi:hypothetical protein
LTPKERIRAIAMRLQGVLLSSTREETVAAVLELQAHAIQDVAFLLQRETALRQRLAEALQRAKQVEEEAQKKGARSLAARTPSVVDEVRVLSREWALDAIMIDAFEDEDAEDWYETQP